MTAGRTLRDSPWTTVFHRKPDSKHRLVFFPHAGGSAGVALPLSVASPARVEVVTIQYPGRQWRRAEPPATDIRGMAGEVARALTDTDDRPIAIFGHSMGAIVGFETALMLEATHPGLVTRLFASGSGPPSRPRRLHLNADATDDELVAELRQMGGTDETHFADGEALRLSLPALRDDYRAMAAYRCARGARVASPIIAMVGRDDPATGYDDAAGWVDHTRGGFGLRVYPGGHFYLNECRQDVLNTIMAYL